MADIFKGSKLGYCQESVMKGQLAKGECVSFMESPSTSTCSYTYMHRPYSVGELCLILDTTQNGRRFVDTKINPQVLFSAFGNVGMNLLFYILM